MFPLLSHFRERWSAASSLEGSIMLQAILEKGWVDHGRIVAIELKPVVHSIVASHGPEATARQSIILLDPGSNFKPRKKR